MSFSVIIPARDAEATIGETITSIQRQTRAPEEIIVVNNLSRDKTARIAADLGCVVVDCSTPGAGAARNFGASRARGNYLVFVDADVTLSENWLETLWPALEAGFPMALTPVVPVGDETFFHRYRRRLGSVRYEKSSLSLRSPGQGLHPVINTAACVYRKDFFRAIGGFDERLHRLEDTELSERAFALGGTIFATERARAEVKNTGGIGSYLKRSYVLGRAKTQLYGLNGRNPYEFFWRDRMTEALESFTPEESLFFLVNQLATLAGMLTETLFGSPLRRRPLHPYLKGLHRQSHRISVEGAGYHLGPRLSLIQIDDDLNFVRFGDNPERVTVNRSRLVELLPELLNRGALAK